MLNSLKLGKLELKNRVLMASLTRGRCPGTVPDELVVQYYEQRASAGLIFSEGILITPLGSEWPNAPGLWNEDQVRGWKTVTDAIHAKGGKIFAQLWHIGRVAHPLHQAGMPVLGPSAVAAKGGKFRYLKDAPGYVTPVPIKDPRTIIELYKQAALNAKRAGFDGVELHSANGYLPHQFLESHSNKRTDEWGGSIENRCKFPLTIVKTLIDVYGDAKCVGVKISPSGGYNDMGETVEEGKKLYSYFVQQLDSLDVGYIQLTRYLADFDAEKRGHEYDYLTLLRPHIKKACLFVNGNYQKDSAEEAIKSGMADAVVFGRPFIANADLPDVFANSKEMQWPDWTKLYGVHAMDGSLINPKEGYLY